MPTTAICVVCGKTFPTYPSRKPKYCSMECYSSSKVVDNCLVCGKEIRYSPSRKGRKKYCSKACLGISQRNRHIVDCSYCGVSFEKRVVENLECYCSHECRTAGEAKYHQIRCCSTCNKPFDVLSSLPYRFCSQQCAADSRRKSGSKGGFRGSNWSRQRNAALKRDGHKCRICGAAQRKGLKLDVHHITPFRLFSDYKEANEINNLLSLCRVCHAKVESGAIACQRPLM